MDINNNNNKKKVCLNKYVTDANSDRISDLPDAILQHVLSFLDSKYAVRTCVLSTRWQYLWINIPGLNFYLEGYPRIPATFTEEKRNSFVNFMHQVLSRRSSSDIDKFSCYSGVAIDVSRLSSFVDHALRSNVQIVELTYSNMVIPPNRKPKIFLDPFEISPLVFTSKSLRVLKLTAFDEGSISLPGTLSFVTLKELCLKNISIWDNTTDRELIHDCPNLEYLTLVDCRFGELQSLKITASQLTNLDILSPYASDTHASPWKCNIIVSAPNLSSFKYLAHVPLVCSMGNPLNIDTLDIDIWKYYRTKSRKYDQEMGRRMTAMLLEFQHAKYVTLSLRAMKLLCKVPGMEYEHLSPFCNLKKFTVNLKGSSLLRGLDNIIHNSPKAKTTLKAPSYRFNMEDMAKQR